jgi:transcriptional regulator with XRE-family HTH domain
MAEYQDKEHVLALSWRERMGWSRSRLARATGYSESQIRNFEAGYNMGSGEPIGEREMHRYRLACAALHARLDFNWKQCRIEMATTAEAARKPVPA